MQPALTTTTIDLHGYRKSEGIAALTFFLESNQGWVTVITGSGAHSQNGPILRTAVQALFEKRQMEFTLNRGKGSFLVNADSGFVLYEPEAPTDTKLILQKAANDSFTPMSKLVSRTAPVSNINPLPSEVAANDANMKASQKAIQRDTNYKKKEENILQKALSESRLQQMKEEEEEEEKLMEQMEEALSLSMKDLASEDDELRKTLELSQKEFDEKDFQREDSDNDLHQAIQLSQKLTSHEDEELLLVLEQSKRDYEEKIGIKTI